MNSYCEQSCMCCTSRKIDKDCFEQCYRFNDIGIPQDGTTSTILTLWEVDGPTSTCGTLVLEVTAFSVDPDPTPATITLSVLVNDIEVESGLVVDDKIVITSDPLDSIKIQAIASDPLNNNTSLNFTIDLCVNVSYECC